MVSFSQWCLCVCVWTRYVRYNSIFHGIYLFITHVVVVVVVYGGYSTLRLRVRKTIKEQVDWTCYPHIGGEALSKGRA